MESVLLKSVPRKLRIVGVLAFQHILMLLSLFIKNNKNLVVFSMVKGRYWDNSKALFEFLSEGKVKGIEVYWLADPELDISFVSEEYRGRVVPRNSYTGWILAARANAAVICYSTGDFGIYRSLIKRKKLVMLWHAITVKHVALLDKKFSDRMKMRYLKNEVAHYNKMTVSSDVERYYWSAANGFNPDCIVVTGMPRNDILLKSQNIDAGPKFKILYSPTFRDYKLASGSVFFNFEHEIDDIIKWALENNVQFLLRPHPSDFYSCKHVVELTKCEPEVFVDATVNKVPDVQHLLIKSDGLVTDYSSVYIDGLLQDKPVVFLDYDREEYIEKRGLAWDYELITPGPKVRKWPEFRQACEDMKAGAVSWAGHREFVRKMFFKYRDGDSCARVAKVIEEMIHE